jgi:hypothetical protein
VRPVHNTACSFANTKLGKDFSEQIIWGERASDLRQSLLGQTQVFGQ